jgi:repressor LexA
MQEKSIPTNKVRQVRKAKGLTMEQLGERVGELLGRPVHFTTIAKIERSKRGLSGEMLSLISQALDVSPAELVEQMPQTIAVRMVPLIGTIAAGNWREAVLQPEGYIPAPVRSNNTFALRPEGDSMNKVVGEDAIIIVDPDDLDLMEGRLYAIMNGAGETTFKRYRTNPPRLEPVSSNPEHKPIPIGREPFTVVGRVIWQGSSL